MYDWLLANDDDVITVVSVSSVTGYDVMVAYSAE